MSMVFNTTKKGEDAANFIFVSILNQLKSGKRVLFFIPGGSAIPVAVKVSELFRGSAYKDLTQKLTITLTDERYGPIGHPDSNLFQLTERGFSFPQAKLIPVLTGEDRATTVQNFSANLTRELRIANYKIGLFGIGPDGHTAGIIPHSLALSSSELAFGYDATLFSRITVTPSLIEKLDEAVVWAQGEDKWGKLKNLEKEIDIANEPAQILKKVPLLTIFTDMKF